MYHRNPITGTISLCKAKTPDKCKFGGEHYSTKEIAETAQDEINSELTNLMYKDNLKPSLNSKHSAVRAEMLRMGAEYDESVRNDYREVKVAAIQCGHDLEYFAKDPELRKEVERYIASSVRLEQTKKIKEICRSSNEVFDLYRNELCKRSKKKSERTSIKKVVSCVNIPDGGGTINLTTMESPKRGFCLSPYPEYSKAFSGEMTEEAINKYIKDYQEEHREILSKENHYIRLWRSPYDNKLYLDVSIVLEDSKEARKLCKKFDQQAFFDLQTLNGVEVDRNASSGQ